MEFFNECKIVSCTIHNAFSRTFKGLLRERFLFILFHQEFVNAISAIPLCMWSLKGKILLFLSACSIAFLTQGCLSIGIFSVCEEFLPNICVSATFLSTNSEKFSYLSAFRATSRHP